MVIQIYYLYDHMITNILFIRSFLFTTNLQRRRCLYKRKCTKTPPSYIFCSFFCLFTLFFLLFHSFLFTYTSKRHVSSFFKKNKHFFSPPTICTNLSFFLRRVVLFLFFKKNKHFFSSPTIRTNLSFFCVVLSCSLFFFLQKNE
jgi:ATP/ADP translocase